MQFGQWYRRLERSVRGGPARDDGPVVEPVRPEGAQTDRLSGEKTDRAGLARWAVIATLVLLALYYPAGSILDHEIRDDLRYAPPAPPEGASQSVAVAAGLITREVDEVGWVANTPPIAPNALLKYGGNMMNFQMGIITSVSIFTLELRDQIARTRGISGQDEDLVAAETNIREDPERWIFAWDRILPGDTAEDRYRRARNALERYNERLASGDAVFEARADNLMAVLNRMALDLGQSSARLRDQIAEGRRVIFLDRQADKIYYNIKGRLYGYALLLRALREDFADVVEDRDIAEPFDDMLAALETAAAAQPLVVMNGAPGGMAANNHLASQGFYLLYARGKMREITDILAK